MTWTAQSNIDTYDEPGDASAGSDTQQITFTAFNQPAGGPSNALPWVYQASTIAPMGPDGGTDTTGTTFNATTGYPKQMLGPQPSGVTS